MTKIYFKAFLEDGNGDEIVEVIQTNSFDELKAKCRQLYPNMRLRDWYAIDDAKELEEVRRWVQ